MTKQEIDLSRVFNWLKVADVPQTGKSGDMSKEQKILLINLIFEELKELAVALGSDGRDALIDAVSDTSMDLKTVEGIFDPIRKEMDIVEVADALTDILYVTANGFHFAGIENKAKTFFEEVCYSNDTKFTKDRESAKLGAQKAIALGKAKTCVIDDNTLNGERVLVIKNEKGKIMKPTDYQKPNLEKILNDE